MKFMGSKRWMLANGLGELIAREMDSCERFFDLFTGSAAVARHVAATYQVPVYAFDLQSFSVVLAKAVLGRQSSLPEATLHSWIDRGLKAYGTLQPPRLHAITRKSVKEIRQWCSEQQLPIVRAYGGHYFSPAQALWIDALRMTVPRREPGHSVAVAALVSAASKCAAAPGHTAQPFQPTRNARKFLKEYWDKDVLEQCKKAFADLRKLHALTVGTALVADANSAAEQLRAGDFAFVDPPYSGVHYSRFYHVLETIARSGCGEVSGTGRYPSPDERPKSEYSIRSKSKNAFGDLLETIAKQQASALVTFPLRNCSNGLSGKFVLERARELFHVETKYVASRFSTLGGDNQHRFARRATRELVLVLRPRIR